MAKNEQQRQKKLAKKKQKELAKKKQLARQKNELASLTGQVKASLSGEIGQCFLSDSLFGDKDNVMIGNLVVTRRMPDKRMMMVRYLIDSACLGVKDMDATAIYPSMVTDLQEQISQQGPFPEVSPARALKYLLGAVAFAKESGFRPPADYEKVMPIWDGVNAEECNESFDYGLDGMPSYRPGPYEDLHKQMEIVRTLTEHRGEGNFNYDIVSDTPFEMGDNGEFNLEEYDDELDIGIDESSPLENPSVQSLQG